MRGQEIGNKMKISHGEWKERRRKTKVERTGERWPRKRKGDRDRQIQRQSGERREETDLIPWNCETDVCILS